MFSLEALYSLAIALLLTRAVSAPVETGNEVQGPGYLSLGFTVESVHQNGTIAKGPIKRDSFEKQLEFTRGAYVLDLYAGSNKQRNTVLLDTGSTFLWFFDKSIQSQEQVFNTTYDPSTSTTAKILSSDFKGAYGDGSSVGTGRWVEDEIRLTPNGNPVNVNFGDVDKIEYLSLGLLGLSFSDPKHPNFGQSLLNNKIINKNAFSLYLDGNTNNGGKLLYGAVDHAKYTGDLVSLPILNNGIDGFSVLLKKLTLNENNYTKSFSIMVDSGSTDTALPSDVVDQLNHDIFGGKSSTDRFGEFYINGKCPSVGELKFTFESTSISVPQDDFLWEWPDGTCHLQISKSIGTYSVLGQNFLRHAYTVFDVTDKTVSFAPIKYTSESNIQPIGPNDFVIGK